jgi:FKBP-type peptidyl-prolyl cis-trans isomerase
LTTHYTDDTDAGKTYRILPVKSLLHSLSWFSLLSLLLPAALHAQREKLPAEDLEVVEKQWPTAKKTVTGLRYVISKEGEGPAAQPGDLVSVLYTGALLDGKVFDENHDPEHPFAFRLGRGQVIEGWDQGLQLMKRGTKMTLIVPYELGYGTRGNPPKIGRRATLVFEVEMLDIKHDAPATVLPPSEPAKKKKK